MHKFSMAGLKWLTSPLSRYVSSVCYLLHLLQQSKLQQLAQFIADVVMVVYILCKDCYKIKPATLKSAHLLYFLAVIALSQFQPQISSHTRCLWEGPRRRLCHCRCGTFCPRQLVPVLTWVRWPRVCQTGGP